MKCAQKNLFKPHSNMQHVGFKYCSALKLLFGADIFSRLCHLSLKLFEVSGLEVFLPHGG